jgi:hypothetical protein
VTKAPVPVDGYFALPEGPGWGLELADPEIWARPYKKAWHRGDKFYPDGSVAYI